MKEAILYLSKQDIRSGESLVRKLIMANLGSREVSNSETCFILQYGTLIFTNFVLKKCCLDDDRHKVRNKYKVKKDDDMKLETSLL